MWGEAAVWDGAEMVTRQHNVFIHVEVTWRKNDSTHMAQNIDNATGVE